MRLLLFALGILIATRPKSAAARLNPAFRPVPQCRNGSGGGAPDVRGNYGFIACRQMSPTLIEEVRSMTRRLLLTVAVVVLVAVPVALVVFRATPVNLSIHAGTLKCYDPSGDPKAC
jgi:hypothetical protein